VRERSGRGTKLYVYLEQNELVQQTTGSIVAENDEDEHSSTLQVLRRR
jgi:hypothetical protein